ncbi:MAG TPA: 3-oxoacyl-ACP reductase FabG [Bryobacteraceae bacterium]|nr:3-oxoacyl-ACP reductase FabG [Bryobacteraceae bacterium]
MSTVLVTGGSRGIGKAIVEEFAAAGHAVAFTFSLSADAATALVAQIASQGGKAKAYHADVRDFGRAESVVCEAEQDFGPLGVVINNAGIRRDMALHNMTAEAWKDVIEINLTGTFNYCQAAIRGLIRRGGAIVNITSASGISGLPGQTNYSASKAGVIGFTKALAKEVARFGVRVNAIAPGFIESDMTASLDDNTRKKLYAQIPLGKPGMPRDVAKMACYLASPEASYITGQVYAIDGGLV